MRFALSSLPSNKSICDSAAEVEHIDLLAGRHWENDWLIGPDMTLSPEKYFVVVPNMFGNGLSSSPSNTPAPLDGPRFPEVRPPSESV